MATVSGTFDTRREAEMAVERLVQQHHVDRADVRLSPVTAENSAGIEGAGADVKRGEPIAPSVEDAALHGRIEVAVDRASADAAAIREVFAEFGAVETREG